MDKTEMRWAKAVGMRKTRFRIIRNGRKQIVYKDKSGSLYYVEQGKYVNTTYDDITCDDCFEYEEDDLISRKDIIKAIRAAEWDGKWEFRMKDGMELAVDIIKEFQP